MDTPWSPLSPLQRHLWRFTQREPDSSAYNLGLCLWLDGALDRPALTSALSRLVEQHEMLRARFGDGRQRIAPAEALRLEDEHLGEFRDPAVRAQRRAHEFLFRPYRFDDENGVFRCRLYRLADDRHMLALGTHHIAFDGWSLQFLMRQLEALYNGLPVEPERQRYVDHAREQDRWDLGPDAAAQRAFWREYLRRNEAPRALPVLQAIGGSRPALRHALQVPRAVIEGIDALASEAGTSRFTVLFAALQLALARLSGQDIVGIGVPAAVRSGRTARTVGFFVNTWVVAGRLPHASSLVSWLRQLRGELDQARRHGRVPLDAPATGGGTTTLADVAFNYRHRYGGRQRLSMRSLAARVEEMPVTETPFPLTLDVAPDFDGISLALVAADGVVDAGFVDRLAAAYPLLLEEMASRGSAPVGSVSLVSAVEAERLSEWAGCGEWEVAADFPALVRAQAAARPSAVALVHGAERVSYGALVRRATRLAEVVLAHGGGPEQVVAVALERGTAMIEGCLGVLMSGSALLPLDPDYPAERLRLMLADSGAGVLLTTERLATRLPAVATVLFADALPAEAAAAVREPHPDQLAYLIYTSGSTGRPKGVAVSHRGLALHVQAIGRRYGMSAADVELHFASISFDGAIERWAVPLAFGSRLVIRDQGLAGAAETCRVLAAEAVTVACFPPSYMRPLLDAIEETRPALRVRSWTLGGEAFPAETFRRMRRLLRPPRILNGYGPTETVITPLLWAAGPEETVEAAYAPIGTPVGGRRVYVLDQTLNRVPPGGVGELYIGSEAGLARGYHGQPALTAERFLPDPFGRPGERMYRTGDRVRFGSDGVVAYLGRVDQQIKLRGFRIEPGEIEAQLLALPAVREAVVVACRRAGADPQAAAGPGEDAVLVAYLVAAAAVDPRAVQRALAERLPGYMVPAHIVCVEALPLTPAGKVDRAALPAPGPAPAAGEPPAGEAERLLAGIWERLLGRPVGRHDDFFALGGDSILALQVVGQARQAGWRLQPSALFQQQTLAAVAATAARHAPAPADRGPATGAARLTPIQAQFLDGHGAAPCNQFVVFQSDEPLQPASLRAALLALRDHHDALRLRFHRQDGGWRQTYTDAEALPGDILWVRAAGCDDEAERLCTEAHRSLDIEAGVLMRGLCVTGAADGPPRPDRMLLTIHHLAVDGVSWRILIDDLSLAYRQALAGQEVRLPPRTASLAEWTDALAAWPDAARQRSLWERQQPSVPEQSATIGDCERLDMALGPEDTARLLRSGRDVTAVLTTALVQACGRATAINIEGHGRHADIVAPRLDLSRTVGWFTSLYPLCFDWHPDPARCFDGVRERLREAGEGGGLAYGVLRFLADGGARMPGLAPVTLNYLGQYRIEGADDWLMPLTGGGVAQAAENPTAAPLTINAHVARNRLYVEWVFSRAHHDRSAVERSISRYQRCLQELISPPPQAAPPELRVLVPLATADTGQRPLFCLHPVTGRVSGYLSIARALQQYRTIVGVQSLSCAEPSHFDRTMAEMADRYASAICHAQPEGPYSMLGWSLGAALALEVARRLEAAGQRLGFVGLLDPYVPTFEVAEDRWTAPQAQAKLASHLRALLPGMPEGALREGLRRLGAALPRDWPRVVSGWLGEQPVDSGEAEAVHDLVAAWAIEQNHRAVCDGYSLPVVWTPVHVWWAGLATPSGRAPRRVFEELIPVAAGRTVAADHMGIVRDPGCISDLLRILSPAGVPPKGCESVSP